VKAQRLVAAASLAVVLLVSAPMARAGGVDDPNNITHGFVASLGACLSQAAVLGFEIVSSAL
jgi:hypothetical protein